MKMYIPYWRMVDFPVIVMFVFRGGFKFCGKCHPYLGKMNPFWLSNSFSKRAWLQPPKQGAILLFHLTEKQCKTKTACWKPNKQVNHHWGGMSFVATNITLWSWPWWLEIYMPQLLGLWGRKSIGKIHGGDGPWRKQIKMIHTWYPKN